MSKNARGPHDELRETNSEFIDVYAVIVSWFAAILHVFVVYINRYPPGGGV
jgi:hypothetical protein